MAPLVSLKDTDSQELTF